MANIFISHRRLDSRQAQRLAVELKKSGHAIWLDDWEINLGDSIVNQVENGLQKADFIILCFSSSGLSDWVDREWMSTLARQLSGHAIKILPVFLTGGTVPAILADIKYADLAADWKAGIQAILKATS